jgi:hypothetical protein
MYRGPIRLRNTFIAALLLSVSAAAEHGSPTGSRAVRAEAAADTVLMKALRTVNACEPSSEDFVLLLLAALNKNAPVRDSKIEFAAVAGSLAKKDQDKFIALLEKLPACKEYGIISDAWKPVVESAAYQTLLAGIHKVEKKAVPDTRTDQTTTFLADVHLAFPGDDDDERAFLKGEGLYPALLDDNGKEIIPAARLAVRWDPAQKYYLLHTSGEDGTLTPLSSDSRNIPGPFVRAGRSLSFNFEQLIPQIRFSAAKNLDFVVDFSFQDAEDLKIADSDAALDPDFDEELILLRSASRHGQLNPVIAVEGPFGPSLIESDLKIGSAVSDRPIDFVWADPSINTFVAVDEKQRKAFHQFRDSSGTLQIKEFEVLSPADISLRPGEDGRFHYVSKSQKLEPSGLNLAVEEMQLKRGWILKGKDGVLVRLEEDPDSVRGDLSATVKPPRFKPIFDIETK